MVAIKVLRASLADSESARRRFLREGEAIAAVSSPHVVRVSDAGSLHDTRPFLVLEFCEGLSLGALLQAEGFLHPWLVAQIARQILVALEAAHASGIVHRDLKPENVFLLASPDASFPLVKVGDFGIARVVENQSGHVPAGMTTTGSVLCTPAYASPELLDGDTQPASDVYALGHMMAELCDGKAPYGDVSPMMRICAEHLRPEPVPLGERTLASPLAAVIRRAVEKSLEDRYPDAKSMRLELEATIPFLERPASEWRVMDSPAVRARLERLEAELAEPEPVPSGSIPFAPTVHVGPNPFAYQYVATRESQPSMPPSLPVETSDTSSRGLVSPAKSRLPVGVLALISLGLVVAFGAWFFQSPVSAVVPSLGAVAAAEPSNDDASAPAAVPSSMSVSDAASPVETDVLEAVRATIGHVRAATESATLAAAQVVLPRPASARPVLSRHDRPPLDDVPTPERRIPEPERTDIMLPEQPPSAQPEPQSPDLAPEAVEPAQAVVPAEENPFRTIGVQ